MSRPNQGHPTFSVLFNADDVPRRARVSLHNGNNLSVATIAVLDKLVFLLRPAAKTQRHPVLVFTLQPQSTAFALKSADFSLNIALAAIFAILDYECSSVRWRRHTLLDDRLALLIELWRLGWCWWRWYLFFNHCLAL